MLGVDLAAVERKLLDPWGEGRALRDRALGVEYGHVAAEPGGGEVEQLAPGLAELNQHVAIAAIAVIYLGTIGYLGYELWKTQSTTKKLLTEVDIVAPQQEAFQQHIAKWDELEHGIDLNHNTVDILNRISRSIPSGSGLRLTTAIISPNEIQLDGEAPKPQAVNQFSLNLKKNNDLAAFEWQTSEPRQTKLGWGFRFSGTSLTATP